MKGDFAMETIFDKLCEKIALQQSGKEYTDVFMVGEQLKDICRNNSRASELVLADIELEEMSLKECAAEIKKEADRLHKEKKGSCICIPPDVAEGIIREFYGIPEDSGEEARSSQTASEDVLRLEDFI